MMSTLNLETKCDNILVKDDIDLKMLVTEFL